MSVFWTMFGFCSALSLYANLPLVFKSVELYRFIPPFINGAEVNQNLHLGGEYLNIAQALVEGRGYSDPFADGAGATAWMPPLFTFIVAILLFCLGGVKLTALVMVLINNIILAGAGALVFEFLKGKGEERAAKLFIGIYLLTLCVRFWWFFQFTHDIHLLLGLTTLLYLGAVNQQIRWKSWGCLGGATLLSSPVLALCWMGLTLLKFIWFKQFKVRDFVLAALTASVIGAPWFVRNALVFDRFIPVKANAPFELYQANVLVKSGVIDEPSVKIHPFNMGEEYRDLGEVKFIEQYHVRFLEAVKEDPREFIKKICNRFLSATVSYVPYQPAVETLSRYFTNALGILVTVALSVLLVSKESCKEEVRALHLTICLVLSPYIVLSYYSRYALSLVPLQALAICWALTRPSPLATKE